MAGYYQAPNAGPQVVTQQPTVQNVTVVVQQPAGKLAWSTTVADCCADIKICCCVCVCHNWYYAAMASRMGESCCIGLCGCHTAMRAKFRATHNIGGSICDDWCTLNYFHMCTMCQLAREMNHQGYPDNCC